MEIKLSDHFTYGKLLRFSLPSVLMMLFTSLFGMADGFFVSNFTGKTAFAAINFIFPFLMILGTLGFMVGTGGSALIGKTLGEKEPEKANRIFSMLVYLTSAAGVVIACAGIYFIKPAAVLLGADDAILKICVPYGRIVLLGLPSLILQFAFESFFIVAERPKLGLYNTIGCGCLNIVFDALLIGTFRLGIQGAAIATLISHLAGIVLPLAFFTRDNNSPLRLGRAAFDGRALLKTLTNGSSEFVSSVSMSAVSMLYNVQLMRYAGENGIAAYGVLMYVSFIFIGVFIGFSSGTAPVVSFHYGAGNTGELANLLKKSITLLSAAAVLMFGISQTFARPFAAVFVGYDAELLNLTVKGFRYFSFAFLFCPFPIFGSSFFTGLNNGGVSAAISFLRTVVFEAASVLWLPLALGIEEIWLSLLAAEVAAAALTVIFLIIKRKRYGYW